MVTPARAASEMPPSRSRAAMERTNTPGSPPAEAVAEQRAAGAPAGGIDGHDRQRLAARAQGAHEGVEQRRLARARRSGDADARRAGEGRLTLQAVEQRARLRPPLGSAVVGEVERLRHGVALARE